MRKKVLINATYSSKNPTGIGIFTDEIVKELIKLQPDLFHIVNSFDSLSGNKNKKVVNKNFSPESGTRAHLNRIFWTQTGLAYEYYRNKYDLLFSTLPEAPVLVKDKVVVVHDIIPLKFPELKMKMRYYFQYIVPGILNTSKFLVFVSEFTRKDVYNHFNLKNIPTAVIHQGYDREKFKPVEKGYIKKKFGYNKYFFYVGDMRPYKNLENAIQAFARASIADTQFIIAGKEDKRFTPGLKKLVKDLDQEGKVIFTDYIIEEDMPHFYSDAIALFFPSRYEGFGLPPLEAMATGTPVITTGLTALPEVCGDAALYIDPDDINEMANALKNVNSDAGLRNKLSEKSLKQASRFSWEKTAKEYYKILLGVSSEE